mmetsp:Transcript_20536/g.28815  ORF Transcript_20536/g.28815 Transcript_20536/m.28815 type:complete len:593 (-) Transcript_20536:421-2199(-)
MATPTSKIDELVSLWMKWDKNPKTRSEIQDLVTQNNVEELSARLGTRIAFGTAGLRGKMQAGFACMNDLTVIQASQGLCMYILETVPEGAKKGVFIGYDGRHNSKEFAVLTAATFLSKGVTVYMMPVLSATPIVSYGTVLKGCIAGVMITASHNPKDDNGYKVYWDNGSQIISPHDSGIATCINKNLEPWNIDHHAILRESKLLHDPLQDILTHYFRDIKEKCSFQSAVSGTHKLGIVFTPMHGVGHYWTSQAFKAFGLADYIPVPEQIEPDGDFPTVAFPNPEEGKGALKLAMETAKKHNVSVIIANDPDADRLAAAELQPSGEWKIFTGNEIGILLAHWVWTQYQAKHKPDPAQCAVLNSTVSSKMLRSLAQKEGLIYEETLTGFKWLGNKADLLRKSGKKVLFAFEEAIGFMVEDICLDKDGVRGAPVFAEMANYLYSQGLTCTQQLTVLYQKYGYFASNNRYFFCYNPQTMETIFNRIRNGGKYFDKIGAFAVKNIRDLTTGYDNTQPDHKAVLPTSSSTHMITFYFENGAVLTLRGSGTEPKLKYYSEMAGPYEQQHQIVQTLAEVVQAVIDVCLEPQKNGLLPPKD